MKLKLKLNDNDNEKKCFKNLSTENCLQNLVQPNFEKPGGLNPPITNKKMYFIFFLNIEYNLLNKHVEYSDQHMDARHPMWCNKDFNL